MAGPSQAELEANYQAMKAAKQATLAKLEANYQATKTAKIAKASGLPVPPSIPVSTGELVQNAALKGAGNFLGFVDNLSPFDIRPGGQGFKVPPVFGLSQKLGLKSPDSGQPNFANTYDGVMKNAGVMTDAEPQTLAQKLLSYGIEQGVGTLPFGIVPALSQAVLGGGGQVVGEKILPQILKVSPKLGGAIGGVLGPLSVSGLAGLYKKGSELVGPLTEGGAKAQVGALLNDVASNPESAKILGSIESRSPFAQYQTTAESLKDAGLARLENAARNSVENEGIGALNTQREMARSGQLNSLYNPESSAAEISKNAESNVSKAADILDERATQAWNKIDGSQSVILGDSLAPVLDHVENLYGTVTDAPGSVKGLLGKYANLKNGEASFNDAKILRSNALNIARISTDPKEVSVANAVQGALLDDLGANAHAGIFDDPQTLAAYNDARAATALKYQLLGATPKLKTAAGLDNKTLYDASLLNEAVGSNSPDKMQALLDLGKETGVPLDQDAQNYLMSTLVNNKGLPRPQSQLPKQYANKEDLFQSAFESNPNNLNSLQAVLDDIASQSAKDAGAYGPSKGQSMTASVSSTQNKINEYKGFANPARARLGGAAIGAGAGSYLGPFGAALGGGLGAGVASKLTEGAGQRFDSLLMDAIQNPSTASEFMSMDPVGDLAASIARKSLEGAAGGTSKVLSKMNGDFSSNIGNMMGMSPNPIPPTPDGVTDLGTIHGDSDTMNNSSSKSSIPADILAKIQADPTDAAIAQVESSLGKNLKNPESSAEGIFQLTRGTAKNLGVTDPLNPQQNYDGFQALKAQNVKALENAGIDATPEAIYGAHYLGAPTYTAWQNGDDLSEKQKALVQGFQETALPHFQAAYNQVAPDDSGEG